MTLASGKSRWPELLGPILQKSAASPNDYLSFIHELLNLATSDNKEVSDALWLKIRPRVHSIRSELYANLSTLNSVNVWLPVFV